MSEISDSFESAKSEFQLSLRPRAEYLGITARDLARQVRQAFFGAQAQRIQRGRDDIRVMIRYPEHQRKSMTTLHSMMIRAPDGTEVPFDTVAAIKPGKSPPIHPSHRPEARNHRFRQRRTRTSWTSMPLSRSWKRSSFPILPASM